MTYDEYIKWLDESDKRTVKHCDLLVLIIDKDLARQKLSKSKFIEFEKKYNEQLDIRKSYAMTANQINVIMDRILPEFVSFKLTNVCNRSLLSMYGESVKEPKGYGGKLFLLTFFFVFIFCFVKAMLQGLDVVHYGIYSSSQLASFIWGAVDCLPAYWFAKSLLKMLRESKASQILIWGIHIVLFALVEILMILGYATFCVYYD